jgi:hypothetical protein
LPLFSFYSIPEFRRSCSRRKNFSQLNWQILIFCSMEPENCTHIPSEWAPAAHNATLFLCGALVCMTIVMAWRRWIFGGLKDTLRTKEELAKDPPPPTRSWFSSFTRLFRSRKTVQPETALPPSIPPEQPVPEEPAEEPAPVKKTRGRKPSVKKEKE